MRQVLAIVAGALLAALGAVVLGEYDLSGSTVIVGFPLYAVAVTELALTVGRRLHTVALLVIAVVVAGGLTWALWISFGHFRNDVVPPALSWVMVAVAALAVPLWGRAAHRSRASRAAPDGSGAAPAPRAEPNASDQETLP